MSDVVDRIEAAYRREMSGWDLLPDSEERLEEALDRFAAIAMAPRPPTDRREFGSVGLKATRRELESLAAAADAVVEKIEALHAPAIDALADRGVMRAPVVRWARSLSEEARAAEARNASGRGRPPQLLARVVAANVIRDFERMTGNALGPETLIDQAGARGIVPLVRDVLSALAVDADAKRAFENALAERAKNTSNESY